MPLAPLDEEARWQPMQWATPSMRRIEVAICRNAQAIETEWLRFQALAAGTFFQTYQWFSAWLATAGSATGAKPLIVLGRDRAGDLVFLLPFCIRRYHGARILEWMGGQHWRHLYLLLGCMWGLLAATLDYEARMRLGTGARPVTPRSYPS